MVFVVEPNLVEVPLVAALSAVRQVRVRAARTPLVFYQNLVQVRFQHYSLVSVRLRVTSVVQDIVVRLLDRPLELPHSFIDGVVVVYLPCLGVRAR